MKTTKQLLLRTLAAALCLALVGCSGETTDPSTQASPQPSASATAAETGQSSEDQPTAHGANAGTGGGSTSASTNSGTDESGEFREIDGVIVAPKDKTLETANDLTVMNIEPGTERYFQNTPNEAELAYARKRNKEREEARLESEEARKDERNSGNDAPVMDPGGGAGLVQVGP